MEAKERNTLQLMTLAFLAFLFFLPCIAYSANPTVQQKQGPVSPTINPLLNPNAPPKGTITINASSKANVNASTWYTGSYQFIQWTCNGTRSNLVDVTLWQNNSKVVDIGIGIATGKTAYAVPKNMAVGSYELRITSDDDTRVEARQPVTVALPTITIISPQQNEVLYTNSKYTIIWKYNGDPGQVDVSVRAGSWQGKKNPDLLFGNINGSMSAVTASVGGGSAVWTLPNNMVNLPSTVYIFVESQDDFHIWASSGPVSVACNKPTISCGNNGYCVDLTTDRMNCGTCGKYCNGLHSTCVSGSCVCPSPYTMCGNYCADLLNNDIYCGACGTSCVGYGKCVNGSCACLSPYAMCGNSCTDLQTDTKNCGKCGNQCDASMPICQYGGCTNMGKPDKHGPGPH